MRKGIALALFAALGASAALVMPASSQTTGRTQIHVYEVEQGYVDGAS